MFEIGNLWMEEGGWLMVWSYLKAPKKSPKHTMQLKPPRSECIAHGTLVSNTWMIYRCKEFMPQVKIEIKNWNFIIHGRQPKK